MSNNVRDIHGSPEESYKMIYRYLYMLDSEFENKNLCRIG